MADHAVTEDKDLWDDQISDEALVAACTSTGLFIIEPRAPVLDVVGAKIGFIIFG